MYYGKLAVVRNQMTRRDYLYNRGDECVAITGGWTIVGGGFTKSTDNITISHLSSANRLIRTLNTIQISKYDRVFFKLKTTGSASNYSFLLGVTSNNTSVTSLRIISQNAPQTNVEVVFEITQPGDRNLPIAFTANFGVWYVYEIWIDRYEN